ncbi:MAG TPA: acyltransferase [Alphaproteobacteria bacterium]|nr:acyltransferase [Alphaproteobacteria bacterium]
MKRFARIWNDYWRVVQTPASHRNELISVQWLRGIAVMMVIIYHIEDIARLLRPFEGFHSPWVLVGYSAPDLFFVISGFIMCYVTFGMPFSPRRWLLSRFIRIWPLYIAFTFVAFCAWLYNPHLTMGSGPHDWTTILKSFLILPQEGLPVVFVGWTVEHEIVFYFLVFCVAMWGRPQALLWVLGALSALGALRWALRDDHPWMNFWDWHFLSLYMIQFLIGALIFQFREPLRRLKTLGPIVAGVALFISGGALVTTSPLNAETLPRVMLFGVAYGLMLLGAVNKEYKLRETVGEAYLPARRPFLVAVGDASYSVYLAHPFILSICGKILGALDLGAPMALVGVAIMSVLTVGGGMLIHVLIERPMLYYTKGLVSAKRKTPLPSPPGSTR